MPVRTTTGRASREMKSSNSSGTGDTLTPMASNSPWGSAVQEKGSNVLTNSMVECETECPGDYAVGTEARGADRDMMDAQQNGEDADDDGPNLSGLSGDYGEAEQSFGIFEVVASIAGGAAGRSDDSSDDAEDSDDAGTAGFDSGSGSGGDEVVRTGGSDDEPEEESSGGTGPQSPVPPEVPHTDGGDPTPDSDKDPVVDKYPFGIMFTIPKIADMHFGWATPKDDVRHSIDLNALLGTGDSERRSQRGGGNAGKDDETTHEGNLRLKV